MLLVWQRIEGKSSDGGHYAECHSITAQNAIVSHLVLHRRKEARGETSITPLTRALSEPLEFVGGLFDHAFSMAHNQAKVKGLWTLIELVDSTHVLRSN
jgi:hypothetical protein